MKVKVSKVVLVITGLWHETKDNSEIGKRYGFIHGI